MYWSYEAFVEHFQSGQTHEDALQIGCGRAGYRRAGSEPFKILRRWPGTALTGINCHKLRADPGLDLADYGRWRPIAALSEFHPVTSENAAPVWRTAFFALKAEMGRLAQTVSTVEPTVLRASSSRCACAACSNG